jgi:hypothetical protein
MLLLSDRFVEILTASKTAKHISLTNYKYSFTTGWLMPEMLFVVFDDFVVIYCGYWWYCHVFFVVRMFSSNLAPISLLVMVLKKKIEISSAD